VFDVYWLESAILQLAEFWVRADSALREAITAASHRVDEALKHSPLESSESREDDQRRILIDLPLVVVFEVDVARRVVPVLSAIVADKRGPRN
jgi:hypothetical protein